MAGTTVGHVDDAGFVYITDRANDMIISGGANVPAEVERVMFTLDGIAGAHSWCARRRVG
jgi:acyl-CoA synthetase (AMP-forming)/AMP-acid ligase II